MTDNNEAMTMENNKRESICTTFYATRRIGTDALGKHAFEVHVEYNPLEGDGDDDCDDGLAKPYKVSLYPGPHWRSHGGLDNDLALHGGSETSFADALATMELFGQTYRPSEGPDGFTYSERTDHSTVVVDALRRATRNEDVTNAVRLISALFEFSRTLGDLPGC